MRWIQESQTTWESKEDGVAAAAMLLANWGFRGGELTDGAFRAIHGDGISRSSRSEWMDRCTSASTIIMQQGSQKEQRNQSLQACHQTKGA